MHNPTPIVGQHQEDVEHLETDRRDREEVHGHCSREVSVQERAPRLRRSPPAATHVLADAGLTDVDAKFEQLTVDTWCAPQRVLSTHWSNQLTDVVRNGWASWPAVMALPRPEQPEDVAMPRDDGVRLDDDERRRKNARKPRPRRCGRTSPGDDPSHVSVSKLRRIAVSAARAGPMSDMDSQSAVVIRPARRG